MAEKPNIADLQAAAARRVEARRVVQARIATAREALKIARKSKVALNAMGITVKSTSKAAGGFVKRHPKAVAGGAAGLTLLALHKPIIAYGRKLWRRFQDRKRNQQEQFEDK